MKALSAILIASALLLSACSQSTVAQIAANNARHQHHDHAQSDAWQRSHWAGRYAGNIPCAECDHIHIQLQLNPDRSYILQEQHRHGQHTTHEHLSRGQFVFDRHQARLIHLDGADGARTFLLEPNSVQARQLNHGTALSPRHAYRLQRQP